MQCIELSILLYLSQGNCSSQSFLIVYIFSISVWLLSGLMILDSIDRHSISVSSDNISAEGLGNFGNEETIGWITSLSGHGLGMRVGLLILGGTVGLLFLKKKLSMCLTLFIFRHFLYLFTPRHQVTIQFWTHTAWSSGQKSLDHSQLEAKTRPISVSDWFKPQFEPTISVSLLKGDQTLCLQRGNRCDGRLGIENVGFTCYLRIILAAPLQI